MFLGFRCSVALTKPLGAALNLCGRYFVLVAATLSLIAVSPQQTSAQGRDPSPDGVPIELSRRFGMILVKAEVDDRPAILVIDTGSSHTILSKKLCSQTLNLQPAPNASKGSGWVGNGSWIKASVKLGDAVWRDHKFLAMDDFPDISATLGQTVDGIVGEDILQEFKTIQIDFTHRRLILSR